MNPPAHIDFGTSYETLDGREISLAELSDLDRRYLAFLAFRANGDEGYFSLLPLVRGLGSYPLKGVIHLTESVASSALFLIADDIVTRAGLRQGLLLAERHDDPERLTVSQAAAEVGVSRAALNQMLREGKLDGERIGKAWVIKRSELSRYLKDLASPGRRHAQRRTLLFKDINDVHERLVRELDQPSILHAHINPLYAFTALRSPLSPSRLKRLRAKGFNIDVLSDRDFEAWIEDNPVKILDDSGHLVQSPLAKILETRQVWRFRFRDEGRKYVTEPLMSRLCNGKLSFCVYHAIVLGDNGYLDIEFDALPGQTKTTEQIALSIQSLRDEASRIGVLSDRAPHDGVTIWCDYIRTDVQRGLEYWCSTMSASAERGGFIEGLLDQQELISYYRDLVEDYYPYYSGRAALWLDTQELQKLDEGLRKDFERRTAAAAKDMRSISAFYLSLSEIFLICCMASRREWRHPRDVERFLSDAASSKEFDEFSKSRPHRIGV